ncbi:ArsR/SmtB family transcription factor [Sphingomonas sp.]|uniref:ArsR/SmtB family transcription factor n=1 Tax=Sphingomonas sp. TaxID=28214 RepID=UPI003B3B3513
MVSPLALFRALADPTRLRIVALLRRMELSVGELAQVLGQSQPRVSRHVRILTDVGLCGRRREGSWVFLRLGPSASPALFTAIDGWRDSAAEKWELADAARLEAVRADRAAAAEAYFNAHAADWDAIRSLHVAEEQVEAAIAHLLANHPIGRLVDIGTGTGRMLELLGSDADSAIGIDRSPEMLRFARARMAAAGIAGADLRQGDMYALPLDGESADTVVLHLVLHYAEAPAAAVREAARLIAPGGRLLIVDFAAHEREELREREGHARLGFDDEQMAGWFVAAGLDPAATETLAGGELTVKIWLGLRRADDRRLRAAA